MKTIRFDNLKRRAADEFVARVGLHNCMSESTYWALIGATCGQEVRKPRELLSEWIDHGLRIIAAWDIRRVKTLVGLFPSSLPKHLHSRVPMCDYDERGEWCLYYS